MNFGPTLFVGAFFTFFFAWMGLVFFPTGTGRSRVPPVRQQWPQLKPRCAALWG